MQSLAQKSKSPTSGSLPSGLNVEGGPVKRAKNEEDPE